ncbi:MAG: HNH endonuclease [Muribaculaceae bacterium]|nr:HNH endonuclease [Muribaculaceae bacterium]MDE6768108.1 HNH endonuclease [Muribaculaceae bacterium]
MIRIFKHPVVPQSLVGQVSWNGNDVNSQLMSDQHCKCYLCERRLVTDFQVEHLKCRKNHSYLAYVWDNLFWSCDYCNKKKSDSFDNILNPTENDIENLIYQKFDFPKSFAEFRYEGPYSDKGETTIQLLSKIFNGSHRMRTIREQQIYDYAKSRITSFQEMVLSWMKNNSEAERSAIIEELDINSEFLGFKYWIIRSNSKLLYEFGNYIVWNKKQSK